MDHKLAFVLSGGGARGALEVGALRALFEAGIQPDILVGTSIGAVNATFLAVYGYNRQGMDGLVEAWQEAAEAELLPSNYLWLTIRSLFNRPARHSVHRIRDFFINHGLLPDVRFSDLQGPRLFIISADLNAGKPIIHGYDPEECVLDALLASTALPPWISPISSNGKLLMDGGVVSGLPVEPAIKMGATEIIALNLADSRDVPEAEDYRFNSFLAKMFNTVAQRQMEMELALANSRGIRVYEIGLLASTALAVWNFQLTDDLMKQGYEIAWKSIRKYGLHLAPDARGSKFTQWLRRKRNKLVQQMILAITRRKWAGTIHLIEPLSGQAFQTQVLVASTEEGFMIPLVEGPDIHWCRNFLKTDTSSFQWQGASFSVCQPQIVDSTIALPAFPHWMQPFLKPVSRFLLVERAPDISIEEISSAASEKLPPS